MTKTILMVDDSRTALTLQRMMLTDTSYRILSASDGRRGVELALAHEPDLILMDVIMPEMTGFEAVRQIRREPRLREIPIIMVTTRGESVSVAEGFTAGCTSYITKPFNASELLEQIIGQLGEDGAEEHAR